MVADIDPHVIGITESWANKDIVDAELAQTIYVMCRKDRRERRGGGVILYIKESIQAYEITLKSEADCEEAIWCNIVTRNSTLTIGVVYRSLNIGQEEDVKLQKAIRLVSKGECVIMGDFNHGHIQWESLECWWWRPSVSTSNTGLFPYSTCLGTNQRWECVRFNFVFSKWITWQC